jgi:hypothetical protein
MHPLRPLFTPLLVALAATSAPAAPVRRAPARAAPTAASKAPAPAAVTAANLGAVLASLGYKPALKEGVRRVQVEEPKFGYWIDLSFSKSGEWLVCMAHLAPIPDLTKVPASPLLSLLATNDTLLGTYFSYDRTNGQVMLNAALPSRGLTPALLKNTLEKMKATVRETQGLWDPARW